MVVLESEEYDVVGSGLLIPSFLKTFYAVISGVCQVNIPNPDDIVSR